MNIGAILVLVSPAHEKDLSPSEFEVLPSIPDKDGDTPYSHDGNESYNDGSGGGTIRRIRLLDDDYLLSWG